MHTQGKASRDATTTRGVARPGHAGGAV